MCENVSNNKKKRDSAEASCLSTPFSPSEKQNPNHLFKYGAITRKNPSEILTVM